MQMTKQPDGLDAIAQLRQQVADTRNRRMAAQKLAATSPLLSVALERVARDRSSGATIETDNLRDKVEDLRNTLTDELRKVDHVRALFQRADRVFTNVPQRTRLVSELNSEAKWRAIASDGDEWA
jgi:hypothetical protein